MSAERVRDDTWKLTASNNGATGYVFQCWNRDGYCPGRPGVPADQSDSGGDPGRGRGLHRPLRPPAGHRRGASQGPAGAPGAPPPGTLPIYAGTRVTVSVRIEDNSRVHLRNSHLAVYAGDQAAVEAGTAALLAQEDSGQFGLPSTISVAVWPQGWSGSPPWPGPTAVRSTTTPWP
ncbi:MAG: hypothetical protein ACLSAF_21925 [Intestinimonas sp.]